MRTSISMPPALMRKAHSCQRRQGFSAFSDYVQHLIRLAPDGPRVQKHS